MDMSARIESLKQKHQELETAIEQEYRRPTPDEVILHDLKRRKLEIKDEISQLSSH